MYQKYSRPTTTVALRGIKFFFERTLGKQWTSFDLIRPPREKKLPTIVSVEEVRKILSLVRLPRYRVCLSASYWCGLRLQEGTLFRAPSRCGRPRGSELQGRDVMVR
jgi:integrase/recombinase XerD